jgi:hypothetical protein
LFSWNILTYGEVLENITRRFFQIGCGLWNIQRVLSGLPSLQKKFKNPDFSQKKTAHFE